MASRLATFGFVVAGAGAAYLFGPALLRLLAVAMGGLASVMGGGFMAAAAVVFAGWLLFSLRSRYQAMYGRVELGVASAMGTQAWISLRGSDDLVELGLSLMAAVYVAVRAFDNISKGSQGQAA